MEGKFVILLIGLLGIFTIAAANPSCDPCETNGDCPKSEYCAKRLGDCGGQGLCDSKPETCTREWAPVCGCDGQTYSNACQAKMAGVSVESEGECPPDPRRCFDNDDCDKESYCLFDECAAETGVCEPRPERCPLLWEPVCGCDGKDYDNSCAAAINGVSVDYEGECRW